MQKAYKLYFSANLQLVIGKDSNNKKILCVTCPSPPPKAEMKEKIKNRTEQKQKLYHMTLGSFSNPLLPIKICLMG